MKKGPFSHTSQEVHTKPCLDLGLGEAHGGARRRTGIREEEARGGCAPLARSAGSGLNGPGVSRGLPTPGRLCEPMAAEAGLHLCLGFWEDNVPRTGMAM